MEYYPICLDVTDRKCIVVGGGRVAERKVKGLLACKGAVTVISPELTENLAALVREGSVLWEKKQYSYGDLKDAFLVIAATDDNQVQVKVHEEAEDFDLLLNVADVPSKCNFILPAHVERGDLTIAVSTAGKSPALAKKIRHDLEDKYGIEYAMLVDILGLIRPFVLAQGKSQKNNEDVFNRVLSSDIIDWLVARDWDRVKSALLENCGSGIDQEILEDIKSIVLV